MKITVCLDPASGRDTLITFHPLFTFLSAISSISDIFDHYYAASHTATRTWFPFKRLLFFPTPVLHYTYINPTCLYYKKRNWLSTSTHLYLRTKKNTFHFFLTDGRTIILAAGGVAPTTSLTSLTTDLPITP